MIPNNNNLNNQLKKLIIFLGLSLIMASIALAIAFVIKNKFKKEEELSITTLSMQNAINDNFSEACQPLTIEYKENYIAINSKKCNKILIININTGKEFYKQY